MLGPFRETGGMATVASMTASGMDAARFDVMACDTGKDTPVGRSTLTACWSHARRWLRLVRALRRHRPDVVHIHTCSYQTFQRTVLDALTCLMLRKRYILHVHGGLFEEYLSSAHGVQRRFVVAILRRSTRVVVLGKVWRTKLTRQVAGLRTSVIPNALPPLADDGNTDLQPPISRAYAPPDCLRGRGVLFVGDLSELKRPEDLIVAYAALPSPLRAAFRLTLAGDGNASRRTILKNLAAHLGVADAVQFIGPRPPQAIRRLMEVADLLVLPSRAEGMPLALIEAMHAELPSIVTRVGAIPEMVADGIEAVLIEPFDPLALARAMKLLLTDEPTRRAIGRAAHRRVLAAYAPDRFRASIETLWTEVAQLTGKAAVPIPRLAASTFRSVL